MPIIGLQGIKEGVGTTSITAGLGWALKSIGESCLMIDCSPRNLLRLNFNIELSNPKGWAYASICNQPLQTHGFKYCKNLYLLPYGHLSDAQQSLSDQTLHGENGPLKSLIYKLKQKHPRWWILINLPARDRLFTPLTSSPISHYITVLNTDAQSLSLIPRIEDPMNSRFFLLNKHRCESALQNDIKTLLQERISNLLPVIIHEDEAIMESLARKLPPGQLRRQSLAAEEFLSLASWCVVHCQDPAHA